MQSNVFIGARLSVIILFLAPLGKAFMLKYLFITLFAFTLFTVKAQIPTGYYSSAQGLTGVALKAALHDIIKNHHALSYDSVKIALRVTDQDTVDTTKVICFYTGWTYGKYDFGNGSEDWNREHVWSKSHGDFGNNPPEGTDLHQLRPADASVNSAKSNRDFNWGVVQYIDGSGPTECYKDTDVWEPRDEVKGDVARIIFYMATRYEGDNGETDLEPVDSVNTAVNNEPFYGKLSTLLAWHQNDPVDQWEQRRNDTVYYHYQHNRNPFIDHPEYVDSIWGNTIYGEPSNHVSDFIAASATSTSVTLTWDNNDGDTVAQNFLVMINQTGVFTPPADSTEYPNDTDLTDSAGVYNVPHNAQTYTWENLSPQTAYYFTIYPYNNSGDNINYKTDGVVPTTMDSTAVDTVLYLIISEVADPSDNYEARFVEITNVGNTDVNFSDENWYLSRQANGSGWADIALTGVLKSDSSMVVAYNSDDFFTAYGFYPDISSGYITGNGDDGYFLYKNGNHETGTLIDAYGVIDQDGTGQPWEYLDSRAVRIFPVTNSDTLWTASQWVIESAGTADMAPKWHRKTLTWNGSTSSNVTDKANWDEAPLVTARYSPDASCKLIFTSLGTSPVLNQDRTFSVIELENNAVLNVGTNVTLTLKR